MDTLSLRLNSPPSVECPDESERYTLPSDLNGVRMDNTQHRVQDSCEAYAVLVMQRTAEDLSVATTTQSDELNSQFIDYLFGANLTQVEFESGEYKLYKENVDAQVPRFIERLAAQHPGVTFTFENVERDARNNGRKADVDIHSSAASKPIPLSIKNYIGSGGITRPQVSSGTFLSFACGFVFDRIGVGTYEDPREAAPRPTFRGSDAVTRDHILQSTNRESLIPLLSVLASLQAEMRADLLGEDMTVYDQARVRAAVERSAVPAIRATLQIFDVLGTDLVREKFLARAGLDGKEEALFFDAERYVDSITNPKYHSLRERLNAESTTFLVEQHRQAIRFSFIDPDGTNILVTDVPFTINTNGAWYRPKEQYDGVRVYNDKGHDVELTWGQRRPYKSREIATSTNTYINLIDTGIFD